MTVAISVNNLSKAYRIGLKEEIPDTLASAVTSWLRAPLRNLRNLTRLNTFAGDAGESDLHWALKDISFDVAEGDVVGIIGHNGAGKSTLLKILSRITQPTSGRAVIHGRVSSLLEVGTGFHPELSGRENIYMNGTILGMRKGEIDRKFDEIVDFSGIEKFLDTPIKRYSSGMKVRLAFAVAAHLEPEILVIDEVLAVGDQQFQNKCLGKMEDVAKGGRTVLFVSHNMAAVEHLCGRCIMLEHGNLIHDDLPVQVIGKYLSHSGDGSAHVDLTTDAESRAGSGEARIESANIHSLDGLLTNLLPMGDGLVLEMSVRSERDLDEVGAGVAIYTPTGTRICGYNSVDVHSWTTDLIANGSNRIRFCIEKMNLSPGTYRFNLSIRTRERELLDRIEGGLTFTVVEAAKYKTGRIPTGNNIVFFDVAWSSAPVIYHSALQES